MNEEIMKRIKDAYGRKERTNCVIPIRDIEIGLIEGRFEVVCDNPVVLIESHGDYYQMYYFSSNKMCEELFDGNELVSHFLPLYSDMTLVENDSFDDTVFKMFGLEPFRVYVRKRKVNNGEKYRKLIDTSYAQIYDLHAIYHLLKQHFDLMADHIPAEKELAEMINSRQVLKLLIADSLAGVLLFEDKGKKSYARALCVEDKYQNSFIGYSLFADYFDKHDLEKTKIFELWVDELNQGVKKLHDRFGYKADGLKNYVYRRK